METSPRVVDAVQRLKGIFLEMPGTQLSMADATIFRRSAEGVDAIAGDIWRREQTLTSAPRTAAVT